MQHFESLATWEQKAISLYAAGVTATSICRNLGITKDKLDKVVGPLAHEVYKKAFDEYLKEDQSWADKRAKTTRSALSKDARRLLKALTRIALGQVEGTTVSEQLKAMEMVLDRVGFEKPQKVAPPAKKELQRAAPMFLQQINSPAPVETKMLHAVTEQAKKIGKITIK